VCVLHTTKESRLSDPLAIRTDDTPDAKAALEQLAAVAHVQQKLRLEAVARAGIARITALEVALAHRIAAGQRGIVARNALLTAQQRHELAVTAAKSRWHRHARDAHPAG
jgi:hypothetical protein